METLRLTLHAKLKWLKDLKGGPITVLLYLWLIRRAVHRSEIDAAFGWDKATTRKHLVVLEANGLASNVNEVWQLVQAGFQLALEFQPTDLDAPATGVGEIAPASTGEREILAREILAPSIISIINSDSLIKESINNNNTAEKNSRAKNSPHLARLTEALRAKHIQAPDDDPLPADLRECVNRLVRLGAPRQKAEIAVATSPLSAAVILEQITAWQARKKSPEGRTIRESGFPYLVMSRIKNGDVLATAGDDPWAGYLTANTESESE